MVLKQTYEEYKLARDIQTGKVKAPRVIAEKQQRRVEFKQKAQRFISRRIPQARVRRPGPSMIRQESAGRVARFITGRNIPRSASKGYSGRGRPKGTYKYYIPGRGPSSVFEWRKYQRYRQRLAAMELQQQNPDLTYQEARSSLQQIPQQITNQVPVQSGYQVATPQPSPPQIIPRQTIDDGWGLLRVKSPISMTSPMVSQARPVGIGINAQQPVGNKYTDFYSEPDFISGQQVMKRRSNIGGFGLW